MNIKFLGAAKKVTGSCYLIEACEISFIVDCGMHQGGAAMELLNFDMNPYQIDKLSFVLLTHAHIDHSGLLPKIYKEGFSGVTYCTEPTKDLASIMLEDSGHIQEIEASWKHKKAIRRGDKNSIVDPLYTAEDATTVVQYLTPIEYDTTFEPHAGIKVTYRNSGHILGSAFLEICIKEGNEVVTLVFSGDLGRSGTLLMYPPSFPQKPKYLLLESTYGDREHKNEEDTLTELAEAINYSYSHKEKIVIPAFAVGRTQEILYCLFLLRQQNKIPQDIPIILDSPLAIRATEVFKKHKKYLNTNSYGFLEAISDALPNLIFTLTTKESQAINELEGSAIIISASGMCNAGRIKHHLRHNLWRPGVSVIFVGYQAVGSPGRKIVDGAKSIKMLGENIAIEAKIYTIGGFSAHAGQSQLIDWTKKMYTKDLQVILVHGEEKASEVLAQRITNELKIPVHIPNYLETMHLTANSCTQEHKISPHIEDVNWDIFTTIEKNLENIKEKLTTVKKQDWETQLEMQNKIIELNKELLAFLNE